MRSSTRIALSLLRLWLGRRWPGFLTPIVRFQSTQITADLTTSGGLSCYRYGTRDRDRDLLAEFIGSGDIMIDGGANIGLFTIAASVRVGEAGRVYASEPAPTTRAALERNIKAAGSRNVVVISSALGATAGRAAFIVMPNGGGLSSFAPENPSEGLEVVVDVSRLDDLIPREDWLRVRLVKLDLEGGEVSALGGAQGIISTAHPVLLLEVEDGHLRRQGSSASELRGLLSDMGYSPAAGAGNPNELYIHPNGVDRLWEAHAEARGSR